MPCLMLISGYFCGFSIKKGNLLSSRTKRVLIPTLIWSLIPFGINLFFGLVRHQPNVFMANLKIPITYYWFMWAILFGSLIIWFVHSFCKDNIIVFAVLGIAFLFIPKVLNFDCWFFMYPFYIAGYLWNIHGIGEKLKLNYYYVIAVFIIYVALFIFYDNRCYIYTTGLTVRSWKQLVIDMYRYLIGFTGSALAVCLIYYLYRFFGKTHWAAFLSHLGKISLLIYCIDSLKHFYLPKITRNISFSYLYILIETVLCIILYVIINIAISKIPLAKKYLLGGR